MLQCVCSVLQCVGVCCSVLQRTCQHAIDDAGIFGWLRALQCAIVECVAVCCSVLQCVTVCCRVLQCVAVRCSVLQRVAVYVVVRCSVLQFVAVRCSKPVSIQQTLPGHLGSSTIRADIDAVIQVHV